jgi:hypothetical protein
MHPYNLCVSSDVMEAISFNLDDCKGYVGNQLFTSASQQHSLPNDLDGFSSSRSSHRGGHGKQTVLDFDCEVRLFVTNMPTHTNTIEPRGTVPE